MPKYIFIKEDEDICVVDKETSLLSAYKAACKCREWDVEVR